MLKMKYSSSNNLAVAITKMCIVMMFNTASPVRTKTEAVGDDLPDNGDECLPVRPRRVVVQEPV